MAERLGSLTPEGEADTLAGLVDEQNVALGERLLGSLRSDRGELVNLLNDTDDVGVGVLRDIGKVANALEGVLDLGDRVVITLVVVSKVLMLGHPPAQSRFRSQR